MPTSPDSRVSAPAVPAVSSAALMGASRLIHIEHGDQVYTLRITRNGRLILTK